MSDAVSVRVVEVGPRDGLQNEAVPVATATKVSLLDRLSACGLSVIEVTSFVSAKAIPQLADAAEVMSGFARRAGVRYPVLVPNETGLTRALAAGATEIAVFTAASDSFNLRNIHCDIQESLRRLRPVVQSGKARHLWVRGYVSCVLGCPYQGEVATGDVVRVARELVAMGCDEVSLGDTIGVGTPKAARQLLEACAAEIPLHQLAVHFHDTYGQALANTYACLEAGVRTVDASIAGLGGCPYAEGASGNLATEDLVYMLRGLGFETGIDLVALVETARWINGELGRAPASKLVRTKYANPQRRGE
jgi:hydroxymethylglutaryl-CoA lyase